MRPLRTWFARFAAMFDKQRRDREFAAELDSHVRMHIEDNLRAGMATEEARRQALLQLGGVEQTKENYRDRRGLPWLETLLQDIRFGVRMLAKSPGLTFVVVVTLALGIGANTAIFGIVNGFLLRPLPVRDPEQITVLAIQQKDAPVGSSGFAYPEFVDFREQAKTFSDVFAIVLSNVQLASKGESEECFANYVSKGFFTALGVTPAAGRLFLPNEGETPGEPLNAVLGYSYWRKRFHGAASVVGQQVEINGRAATIVGVVPRRFQGMYSIAEMDLYLPLSAIGTEEAPNLFWSNRDHRRMLAFGRLKPGITLRQAQDSLDVIAARLAAQYPATDKWFTVRAVPEKLSRPIPYANNAFVAISGLFMVLAAFVLLLACMNVENILLARGASRQREMATRAALGAGRTRLICQMLAESILLGILGGAAGLILGMWVDHLTSSLRLPAVPLHVDATFDWRLFAFAIGCALATGTIVGLLPALHASRANLNSVLHEGGQRSSFGLSHAGARNFLVIAQVAGSFALLIAAGLFVRSLQSVQSFRLGFDPDHVLNIIVDPHEAGYDGPRTVAFYREIESRVRALPGVQSASLASYVPMGGFPSKASIFIQGRATPPGQHAPLVLMNRVDPPYFETMRVALFRGRVFLDSDKDGAPPVAIINQTMASDFWPRENPVGKYFRMDNDAAPLIEIVGVTGDGKYGTVNEDAQPFFYIPLAQSFASKRALQIRTLVPPESLAGAVRDQISGLAPDLSIMDIETMNQSLNGALGFLVFRLAAIFAGVLGMIGLVLGIVGVYGVVSFTAGQRTREIGIRLALGASSRDILRLVWKQGVRLVIVGIAVGLVAAWSLTRAMAHLLADISPGDPVTYVAVTILICAAGLLACWIPARRAMRVDPMVALRYE
ncbi:MAG TPA: ABC transporter permease [Candidatus Acidoferrales bacterium]|nr:ABC transporter permease [Candidatus Acidoferrales bacterium]